MNYLDRGYLLKKEKLLHIGAIIGIKDMEGHIVEMYESGMSCNEIAEEFNKKAPMWAITAKSISDRIRKREKIEGRKIIRCKADSFNLAIKKGRKTYQRIEKQYQRHGITKKIRYHVMERDGFKCTLCGGKDELQIDHRVPVSKGGDNHINNLQTLCRDCNLCKSNNEVNY